MGWEPREKARRASLARAIARPAVTATSRPTRPLRKRRRTSSSRRRRGTPAYGRLALHLRSKPSPGSATAPPAMRAHGLTPAPRPTPRPTDRRLASEVRRSEAACSFPLTFFLIPSNGRVGAPVLRASTRSTRRPAAAQRGHEMGAVHGRCFKKAVSEPPAPGAGPPPRQRGAKARCLAHQVLSPRIAPGPDPSLGARGSDPRWKRHGNTSADE